MKPKSRVLGLGLLLVIASTGAMADAYRESTFREPKPVQRVFSGHPRAIILIGDDSQRSDKWLHRASTVCSELATFGFTSKVFDGQKMNWDRACKAGSDCDLIVYIGHGARIPLQNKTGILFGGSFLEPSDMRSGLKLKSGGLCVFLGACYTTGTLPQDEALVTEDKALERVSQIASGFTDSGVGYLAVLSDSELYRFLDQTPDKTASRWLVKGNTNRGMSYVGAFVAPNGWTPSFATGR